MNLTFTKQGNSYVAEFDATADFNLHIERPKEGYLRVYQRTGGSGGFAYVEGLSQYAFDKIIDLDFTGAVYPKSIKVVSDVQPSLATVNVGE